MTTHRSNPLNIVDISSSSPMIPRQLVNEAKTQGFLMIEGHGFTQVEVDLLFDMAYHFFGQPLETKQKFAMKNSNHGYARFGVENLDPTSRQKGGDPKEVLNLCSLDFSTGNSSEGFPFWFDEKRERTDLIKYSIKKLNGICLSILRLLALGLEIEDTEVSGEEWFLSRYAQDRPSGSTFRFLHYPGQKELDTESKIRAGAHTDYGSLTLLFQRENQEGLEIYSPLSKKWEQVPFIDRVGKYKNEAAPIIVNVGDLLSYWTNGILRSTIHRVQFPTHIQESGEDRYSIVFFSHPNDDAVLLPVPSPQIQSIKGRGAGNEKDYITARQHLDKRLAATYNLSSASEPESKLCDKVKPS